VGGEMAGRSGEDRMGTGSARSSRLARNEARMHSWLKGEKRKRQHNYQENFRVAPKPDSST
jgi:hypothetical protein